MSGLGFNPRAVETQRGSIPPQWRHPPRRVEIAFAHAGNRTQGTSMGGLYVATTLHARTQPERLGRAHAFSRDCGRQRNVTLTHTTHPDDTLAEWLRRRPAKPMGSPCVGLNPTGVAGSSRAADEMNVFFKLRDGAEGPAASGDDNEISTEKQMTGEVFRTILGSVNSPPLSGRQTARPTSAAGGYFPLMR